MNTEDATFGTLVSLLLNYITMLIPIVVALTIIVLSWGVIKAWIINGGDQGSVDKGKNIAVAGVVALVVMVSVWGLVAILQSSLNLNTY